MSLGHLPRAFGLLHSLLWAVSLLKVNAQWRVLSSWGLDGEVFPIVFHNSFEHSHFLQPAACQRNLLMINVPKRLNPDKSMDFPSCFVEMQEGSPKVTCFMTEFPTLREFKVVDLQHIES